MTAWRLSGFADEAYTDLPDQLRFLTSLGIERIDLRHFERDGQRCSIAEATSAERALMARQLREADIACHCVATPVGKAPVEGDFAVQQRQLANGLAAAAEFGSRAVRVFGFRCRSAADDRDCIGNLTRLCEQAHRDAPGVRLLLENERDVFGESPEQILAALHAIDAENLGYVCDPANFAVVGVDALGAVRQLREHIDALHVKDRGSAGKMVLPGEGLCGWPQILVELDGRDYPMTLALEPHLDVAERHFGSTTPQRFAAAKAALEAILPPSR